MLSIKIAQQLNINANITTELTDL